LLNDERAAAIDVVEQPAVVRAQDRHGVRTRTPVTIVVNLTGRPGRVLRRQELDFDAELLDTAGTSSPTP
jgi:hypothetical protein